QHLWTAILQAVSQHVAKHPEELRSRFVEHEGKVDLAVYRDSFGPPGTRSNDWAGVVREWVGLVETRLVERTRGLAAPEAVLRGATEVERTVLGVTTMDL